MTRVSAVTLVDLPAQPVLSVRGTIDFLAEFAPWSGAAFDAVQERLAVLGAYPAGAPFVCFVGSDLSALDVEAGFPTATSVEGDDVVRARTIDATTAAVVVDQGPYEESDPTMTDALAWIADQGREPAGPIYYQYLNDPSFPAERLLTRMVFPVLQHLDAEVSR